MNEELNYGYGAQGIDPITGLPIEGTGPINPNFTSGGKKETKTVDPYAGQVDPATGLPLTDYQKRNPNSIVAPGDAPSFSTKSYYQVDLDAYSDYMDQVKPWVGQTEMDRRRAVGQSGWEQAGKAVVRTVGGAVLDFTGGMASMLDIEDYYNQDDEIGNPITNKMDELKQQLNDALPIYRENPNEAFDFGDPGWWYENGSSLASSIAAFAGQGMVVGATLGAGAAGLAANLGAKAGKVLQGGAKVLTAAGLNQTEAVMEAGAVYKDNMQHYMKMGASEEAAKAKAANDAATVININRANIALNLTSASMFTRMGAQSSLTRELRKAPVKLFSKEGLKTVGLEGIQEFAEEQINYIGSEEGKKAITGSNNESLLEALMDGKSMAKYADDPHFWESGVLGAIGGIGQGGAGFAYRKASGKYKQDLDAFAKQEQRIAELDAMASKTDAKTGTISEVFLKAESLKDFYAEQKAAEKALEDAVKEGDPTKVAEAQKRVKKAAEQTLWMQTATSLQDGTTEHLINGFKNFENLSEDEARKKGLPEDYKERAQDAVKFIEQAEAAYNEMEFRPVSTKMDAVVNRANAHRVRNGIKETKKDIDNVNKAISELRSGLSANDAALSDEALADKNDLFAGLLTIKRNAEALSDYYSEKLNEFDSEYSTLLKDNIGKRAAKKLSKVEELELRKQDAFRERLQDDILDGKITRPVLESLKDDVRRSNHPQKEKRLEILDELIDNIRERENNAFKQKAKEAQLEVLKDVNNQANNLRETLGLSKKQAEKVAEVASKKAENNEKKEEIQETNEALLNADQQSLEQIFSATEMDPQTGLPLTEEDAEVKEKTKQIKDNAPNKTYESLSEERKSELSPEIDFALTAAKSTEEFNQAMEIIAGEEVEPADLALLEKRKEELEQYEAEALKQLKEQEEFRKQALDAGIDPDVMLDAATLTLTELASDEADNAAKDGLDYEPAAGFDNTSEIDAIEGMEEEAKNKRKSKMDAVPKDAVATVDTQFASVVIVEPKTSSLADIEAGVKEKGFYASATDANGNRLRKPATPYAIKPFRSLTKAEQEKAIPLFWYPIRVDDKTGLPLFKDGRGMDKYLYNKSGAPVPLNENAMVGEQLYMVPQGDEIIYEDEIISFAEWTKPDNAKVDSVVYLKKGQYVYPRGEKKGQDIKPGTDHTNEVITIHLTPDGPPVQRLSEGDTDLRRNFETYADKSGAVPVRVAEKNRGMVINQKGPDGQSVKNPISVLGKVNEDYFLGVGRQGNVHYYDGNNWIDAEAQVEEGRVYAMIKSANGELIPIRLETKNISEQDANALIDNVLLNPGISGQVKAQIIADVVSTIRNHNIANAENPRGPLFYVDPIAVKLRVGDMIIAIDHVTTGNYNNLEQALKGETFQARVFETSVSSPNYSYGALRKDKEGKPQRAYFNSKSDASLSKATQEALKDFRATLVKAMTEKTYNVNRNGIAENDMHTDYTQGENGKDYDSYTEYLADKGILTTDVIGLGTGQRFTNSKGHVLPVNKKVTLIAPSSVTQKQEDIKTEKAEDIQDNANEEQVIEVVSETDVVITGDLTEDEADNVTIEPIPGVGEGVEIKPEDMPDEDELDKLFRIAEEQFEKDPTSILTETELNWILNTFGEEHLVPMAQAKKILIQGQEAYGAYSKGLIHLARLGAKGTAYHEAFHLVMDLAMTPNEKQAILVAAQAKYGTFLDGSEEHNRLKKLYPKKTRTELEEIWLEENLAEDFRKFMEAEESDGKIKKTKLGRVIQKIFDRIRQAILVMRIAGTKILNPDSIYLSSMIMKKNFLSIKMGDMKVDDRTKASLKKTQFNTTEARLRSKKGFSEDEKQDALNVLRYGLLQKVIPNILSNPELNTTGAKNISDFLTKNEHKKALIEAIDQVRKELQNTSDTMQKNYDKSKKTVWAQAKYYVDKIISEDGWEDVIEGGVVKNPGFKSLLLDALKLHGAQIRKIKAKESSTDNTFEKQQNEDLEFGEAPLDEDGDEEGGTTAERTHDQHFALSDPKKTLSFEVKTALSFIPAPTIVDQKTGETISTGRSKYTMLPTFIDFHKVYSTLAGKLASVPTEKIESKLEEIAEWNPEVKAVFDAYKEWSPELKNTFKSVMSKTQLKFMTVVAGENEKWELIETNREGIQKQIIAEWALNKNNKNLFEETQGEVASVNQTVLQQFGDNYNLLKEIAEGRKPVDYYNAVNEVFSYVGIEFDAPTLNMFASKYPIESFQQNIVEGKFEYILKDLGYNPKTGKITNTKGADPYVSTESKGQLKTISKIADLVKDLRTDLYTGSFVNGEGKMVYSINLNSYITKFGAKTTTKEGIEELWKEFSQDVYYNPDGNMEVYSSIFLSLLKNNENVRNEFDIIELDTTKDTRKTDGTGFTSMREKQSWLTRLAMFSNNGNKNTNGYAYISMGTKSDKGRSLYMKVPVLQNAKSPNELRRGNRKGIDGVKAAAVHVLRRTVMQEYARIKKVEEQLFGENALRDDQLIENYHYKGTNADGTLNRQAANGLKFLSIPDLNFDNHKMFDSNGRVVKLSGEAVLKRVEKALENFLDREILRGKKRMEGAGVLFEKDGKYYTDIIDGKSFDGVQTNIDGELVLDVDDSIAEFLMNEIVWRTEMNKFQMGDLAFYKTQATDISNNVEFEGNKGKFLSVVTDAGKRGYQSITPGIDHVIDSVYGKPKTMTMAIIGDIFSEISLKEAGNMVYNLLKDKSFKYKPYLTDINKSLDGLTADQKDAIKITRAYLKGSNVADGQGYTTLESHRHSMMSRGDWTMGEGETHEKAYKEYWTKEKDYNKWPDWAKNLALKPLKTFSFGYQYDLATQSMVFKQIKHSTTPLYPAMTKAVPALDKLRQRMEATGEYAGMQKIDVVNMDSAVKVGKSGVNTYTKDGSYLNNLTTQVIYAENERNPFILPTDKGTDPKDGSQFAKLVTGNMPSESVYTTIKGIDSMTTEEVKSVNDAVYAEKLKRSYDKLMKDLQYDEYMKNPTSREAQLNYLKNVQRLLLEQIESRELPDNYSLALEIQELENGQYTFAMPLSFPAYAKKFEIALASLFKSRVLTQRLEGDQAVQVAEYGIEENNLKYYEFEDGKMKAAECAISYKQAEKLGLTKYANENGEIDYKAMEKDGIDRSVLEIIGYRIPTQGKSSMLPLIVKRILPPTAKGQIMLPHAITTQTGADYDVDKLFLYFPKLKKTKDGRVVRAAVGKSLKGLVDGTKDVSSLSDTEIQNILFNIRFGILTSEHNSKEVVNPLDSDTYKNKLKEYDKYGLLEKTGTFNFASGYTDMHLEMVNKDAKMLIGIFSLHSVAQSLSQDTNIETSSPVYIKTKDANGNEIGTKNNPANDLQGQVGFDGILKSIYINENQNAALDNAKEPVTGSLNITLFTSNVISYLNRLGYNNDIAVDFVNQPIIRELSKENDLSDDFWVASLADTVSSRFGLPTKGRDGKELKYSSSEQNRVEITPENLKKQLGKNLAEMTAEELMYQKQVLVDFVQYHKAGADLAKANKAMSPDRFTQMSGLVDIEIWKDNKKYIESNSSEIQIPDLYSENTTLKRVKAYYDYGILGAEEQISNFMPYNSLMFDQTKKDIAFITHQKAGTITDKDLLNTINGDILAYILLGKNSPISLLFSDNYKEVMKKRLFDKNASIAKDVEVIKKKYNLKNNIFLKMLQADTFNSRNSLQMLKFNNAASYSGETKSSFTDAFEELIDRTEKVVKVKRDKSGKYVEMNSEEKAKAVQEVRTVMQRVVQYGILTSGFQSGPNSFIDLFPISLWKNLFLDTEGQSVASLSEYMLNIKDTFNDLLSDNDSKYKTVEEHLLNPELGISGHSNLVDQIVRNRFATPKLVKSVSVVGNKLDVLQEAKAKVAFPGRFRINADNAGNVFTRQTKTTPFSGFPSYLKMWDKGNKKWRLYALQEHKTGPTYGFAEYQVISPLGENNKFFEVYPSEMNPSSIHPDNNDFEMVEKKKAKKESVDIQPDQPGLADIIKTATKADNTTDIEAELNAATPISFITLEDTADGSSDVDFSNMVDLGNISFGSTEMDEVYKKKNEEGDVDGICGI